MKRLAVVLGALWLSGCYAYVPVKPASVQPGARVRAYLTPQASQAISGTIGPKVSMVEAAVDARQDDSLHLNVASYQTADGGQIYADHAPLSLSENAVRQMTQRKLSVERTVLFGILAAAIPALAGVVISGASVATTSSSPGSSTGNGRS